MSEIKVVEAFRVSIIESESGWGQKVDDIIYFDDEHEAHAFVTEFNSKNDKTYVPSWYMYAEYDGKVTMSYESKVR